MGCVSNAPFHVQKRKTQRRCVFLMTSVVDVTPLCCKSGNADTGPRQRCSYDMFIEQICTNPSRQKQKIATRTIENALQHYRSSYDITRVFLKVNASNTNAIQAYKMMGFNKTSQRRFAHASTTATTTADDGVFTRTVGCVHKLDSSDDNDDGDMLEPAVQIDRHNSKDTIEMEILLTELDSTSLDTRLAHKRPRDYICLLSFTRFKCKDIVDSVLKGALPTTGLQVYTHQTYTERSKQDLLIPDTFLLNLQWEKAETLLKAHLPNYEKLFKGIQLFYNVWNVSDSKHYCQMLKEHLYTQNQMSFKPYSAVTKWSDIPAAQQEARIYSMYVDMLLQLNPPRYMLSNMQVQELTKSFQKTQNLSFNKNSETTTFHVAFYA